MINLPSSFTGPPSYMHEKTPDAMTYVRYYGCPDHFITLICNPKWQDITSALFSGQRPHDHHVIMARVFYSKVKAIMFFMIKRTRSYMRLLRLV